MKATVMVLAIGMLAAGRCGLLACRTERKQTQAYGAGQCQQHGDLCDRAILFAACCRHYLSASASVSKQVWFLNPCPAAGTLNTIVTKLQDNVVVGMDAKGQALRFRHPAFQTAAMFAGEALCLLPFGLRSWYKHATRAAPLSAEEVATRDHRLRRSFFVFFLPAVCDAGATTLLNLGLCFTSASVFQMLRGTLVIFAGLLTILLLHRRLHAHHWLGIVLIGAGAALVGASSLLHAPHHHHQTPPTHGLGAAQHQGVGSGSTEAHRQPSLRSLLLLDRLPVTVTGAGGADGDGGTTAPSPLLGNTLVVLAQVSGWCLCEL
jgi:drug/metabolite transporter (DMT)-like permease